jgi:hypothetical protein
LRFPLPARALKAAVLRLTSGRVSAFMKGGRVVVVVVVVLEADLSEAEDHQRQARGASYKAEETRANLESRYWGARARLPRNRGERCH